MYTYISKNMPSYRTSST